MYPVYVLIFFLFCIPDCLFSSIVLSDLNLIDVSCIKHILCPLLNIIVIFISLFSLPLVAVSDGLLCVRAIVHVVFIAFLPSVPCVNPLPTRVFLHYCIPCVVRCVVLIWRIVLLCRPGPFNVLVLIPARVFYTIAVCVACTNPLHLHHVAPPLSSVPCAIRLPTPVLCVVRAPARTSLLFLIPCVRHIALLIVVCVLVRILVRCPLSPS